METSKKTLKDIMKEHGYKSADDLAYAVRQTGARCVTPTIYKMFHGKHKDRRIEFGTIVAVCELLELSLDEYVKLPPSESKEFDTQGRRKKNHGNHEHV